MFRKVLNNMGIGIVIVVMFVAMSFASPYFFDLQNLMNILLQVSISTIIAVGMTIVILTGGIDLSVGSMTAMSGVIIALTLHMGLPILLVLVLAVLFGLLSGVAMGAVNGLIIVKGKVPAFIATLGMMSIARGTALYVTGGQSVTLLPQEYMAFTSGKIWEIPVPVLYAVGVVIIAALALRLTKFGRYIYAIGGNKEAVRLSGVNTGKVEFMAYALSGLACGIGAVVLVGRLGAGQPIAAKDYEMNAIAAAIIGGTSLSGGMGRISGTVMGAILMGMLGNSLNLLNVSTFLQQIITGSVIVAAVLFDQYRIRRKDRARIKEVQKAAALQTE